MVNVDLLKAHAAKYQLNRNNCAEIYRQLFTLHPDMAPYFDAEDLDPDSIPKAQKFLMKGQMTMPIFFKLPQTVSDDRAWRRTLSEFKELFEEVNCPMSEFSKLTDSLIATLEKHAGGVTAEQKKEWEALMGKAAADIKSWGW